MSANNRFLDELAKTDWLQKISNIGNLFYDIGCEWVRGFRDKSLPIAQCCISGSALCLLVIAGFDQKLFHLLKIPYLYPRSFTLHGIYCALIAFSGFGFWAMVQLLRRNRLAKRLGEAMLASGLKNALGRLPGFVFDRPIDNSCRKLQLTRANLSIEKFKNSKAKLESALQIYIEDIKEERASGTVDIIYAHSAMPEVTEFLEPNKTAKGSLVVGYTRANELKINLNKIPHLLVAGQTGGGKSTFLRQLITTLYLRNKKYQFTLVDLKGGLEFSLFNDLKRVSVIATLSKATNALTLLSSELDERMKILGENNCKDLSAFQKIPMENRKLPGGLGIGVNFSRHVIVIDEASEIFLTTSGGNAKETQSAKEAVSRISRLGRAVGINIIIGTQRPDARALDTQIKANLPGKLCFQMADLHSSMVVLGNGRARDLPEIPGRGIWQEGLKMTEVQTPFLSVEKATELLKSYKKKPKQQAQKADVPSQPNATSNRY